MSHDSVKAAFEKQVVLLPLDIIAPQKEVTQGHRSGEFYKQLTASLKHVGVIEPLVVYPRGPGDYLLLDGHVRLEILKSIGVKEVKCLLATDDEAYTYNRHVNHIPAVAQHFMLLEALKNGLTEERIAAALDVSLDSIRAKRDLLNGICSEAVQILADKHLSPKVFWILRRMKPIRQIEAAEHMVAGGTFTVPFAKALLAVTKPEMLEEQAALDKKLQATSIAARSMLEEQNEFLLRDLKSVEESYGTDVRNLLSVLSPREEEVLLLRLEALKYREIAEQLGIGINSVNTLLARALRKLQEATSRHVNEERTKRYAEKPVTRAS